MSVFESRVPTDEQADAIVDMKAGADVFLSIILKNCPASPDRSTAIRHLRDCVYNATASIVIPPEETVFH